MTAISFSAEDVQRLSRKGQSFFNDWLVEGLILHANGAEGAFWPFLAIVAAGEPVDGLLSCYRTGGATFQRKLRTAIAGACAALSPTSRAFLDVTPTIRRHVFQDMSALVPATGAYEATSRLVTSVIEHSDYWSAEGMYTEVFARVYRICCELAITAKDHVDGTRDNLAALESAILKLSAAPGYRPEFSPLGIHALVCISPQRFLTRHRTSYGFHIRALHKLNPLEREQAYITANMIARTAQKELADVSPSLDLAEGGGDRWLIEALTSKKSDAKLIRTENPSEVQLAIVSQTGRHAVRPIVKTVLRNVSFVRERFDFESPTAIWSGRDSQQRRNLAKAYDATRRVILGVASST